MRGVLLVSHGELSKGMKSSIEMIAGKQDKVRYLGIAPNEDINIFEEMFEGEVKCLGDVDNIIVFCDLIGGTPCNTAMKKYYDNEKYTIVSGMNLPMILTAVINKEADINEIISDGINGILDLKTLSLIECEEE